ncbi:hypothetical protein [Streptomyces sp. Act143]|uniref:hypothetical protein n=1 Tax=Streptomyces sp. Act143 TaxID=2200760 RepID=UPI0011B43094|nr:hypothetical protein [Streptomyces sp. Act143]
MNARSLRDVVVGATKRSSTPGLFHFDARIGFMPCAGGCAAVRTPGAARVNFPDPEGGRRSGRP